MTSVLLDGNQVMDEAVVKRALELLQPLIPMPGTDILDLIATNPLLDDILALEGGCGPNWVRPNSDKLTYPAPRKKFFGVPNGEPWYDEVRQCWLVSAPSYSAAYRPKSDWRCEIAPKALVDLGEEARAAAYDYLSLEYRDTPWNGIFLLGYYHDESVPISSAIGKHQVPIPC